MPKYKVGDKVVLRKDLNTDDVYPMEDSEESDVVNSKMIEFAKDKEFVTIGLFLEGEYELCEDTARWGWTDTMFVGLYKEGA